MVIFILNFLIGLWIGWNFLDCFKKTTCKWRPIQLLLGIHQIHHVTYSYGWKVWWFNHGYFPEHAKKFTCKKWLKIEKKDYHNCTITNRY